MASTVHDIRLVEGQRGDLEPEHWPIEHTGDHAHTDHLVAEGVGQDRAVLVDIGES